MPKLDDTPSGENTGDNKELDKDLDKEMSKDLAELEVKDGESCST